MSRPVPMRKLRIICAKRDQEQVIRTLYRHRCLHIATYTRHQGDFFDIGDPLAQSQAVSELLVKTRSLLHVIGVSASHHHRLAHHAHHQPGQGTGLGSHESSDLLIHDVDELAHAHFDSSHVQSMKERLESINLDVQRLLARESDAKAALAHIDRQVSDLEWFEPFYVTIDSMRDAQAPQSRIRIIAGEIPITKTQQAIESLAAFAPSMELLSEPAPHSHKVMVIADERYADGILGTLLASQFTQYAIPAFDGMSGTPEEQLSALRQHARHSRRELREVEHRIGEIRNEYAGFLVEFETLLSRESEQAQAPLRFLESAHVCVIEGFAPEASVAPLRSGIKRVTKDGAIIRDEQIAHGEHAPVLLHNARAVKPFEFLLKLYSLPQQTEFDPSLLLFLTFPLLFGMMLGDIGYGIVTLALFLILRPRLGQLKSLANILILSSISTIAFGFVYGEAFGLEEIAGHSIPHLIHRSESITTLMVIAVIVGALHLTISLLIGFANELRERGFFHAFMAKFGWIFLEAGAFGLVLALMSTTTTIPWWGFAIDPIIPGAIILVSVCMIGYGEGIEGLVELPAIFSNMLSYLRLVAVGLASVSLAVVVNNLAGGLFAQGIGGIIAGVLILILGHTINIALGLLGPFLHTLRLHYVESFTKFFKGGGTPFSPFGQGEAHDSLSAGAGIGAGSARIASIMPATAKPA